MTWCVAWHTNENDDLLVDENDTADIDTTIDNAQQFDSKEDAECYANWLTECDNGCKGSQYGKYIPVFIREGQHGYKNTPHRNMV